MARLIAGMTMSLDGFVSDANGNAGALYPDFDELQNSPYMEKVIAETGAVLMGRRAFDMADDPDSFADSYEFQCPIFVLTHRPPKRHPKENDELTFTFVTDSVESAVTQASHAAGERAVTCIGGADTIEQLMRAGLVDELHVDVMPVLLGGGRRFLDGIGQVVSLQKLEVIEVGQRTGLRFALKAVTGET